MTISNKVTTLRYSTGLSEDVIQTHIDEQNANGYYLVSIDNLSGWYRFFWAKNVQ